MKLTAILLALPLIIGSGATFAADSTTTTQTNKSDSVMGTTESSSTARHDDSWTGKSVEKSDSMKQNADGSTTTQSSKTVNKPN
jgi:hypothetical protein